MFCQCHKIIIMYNCHMSSLLFFNCILCCLNVLETEGTCRLAQHGVNSQGNISNMSYCSDESRPRITEIRIWCSWQARHWNWHFSTSNTQWQFRYFKKLVIFLKLRLIYHFSSDLTLIIQKAMHVFLMLSISLS